MYTAKRAGKARREVFESAVSAADGSDAVAGATVD
jgi:hypothetical protein